MAEEKRGSWTVKGSRIAFENPWLKLQVDDVVSSDGKEAEYNVIHFSSGSIIVPMDTEGNIYLAREYRYGIDKVVVEAFAGGMETGEEPLAAAKRELLEEGGIIADTWTYLGKFSALSAKLSSYEHLFLAENLSFGAQQLDDNEDIEIIKMPFKEALASVLSVDGIQSIQTAALLLGIEHLLREREEVQEKSA